MKKMVSFFLGIFSIYMQPTIACTRIFWNEQNSLIVARTFDWDNDYDETLLVLPRGMFHTGGTEENEARWYSKFGSLVVQENYESQRAITDGINESGLAAHLLAFEGGQYQHRDSTKPGVTILQWLQFYLDNFASVNDVIRNIDKVQIVSAPFAEFSDLSLHVALEDSSGDSAIIEFVKGTLKIYHKNNYRIMTNDPGYDLQLKNLQHYEQRHCNRKELPLDDQSKSRFVRAACYLKSLTQAHNGKHAIALVASIAENVSIAHGMSPTEATWWRTYIDLSKQRYYFKSTLVPTIFWLDYARIDFSNPVSYREINAHDAKLMGDITKNNGDVANEGK